MKLIQKMLTFLQNGRNIRNTHSIRSLFLELVDRKESVSLLMNSFVSAFHTEKNSYRQKLSQSLYYKPTSIQSQKFQSFSFFHLVLILLRILKCLEVTSFQRRSKRSSLKNMDSSTLPWDKTQKKELKRN